MAHELLLKLFVNGLENLAMDNETLCAHLNLRALFYEFPERFEAAVHQDPQPPYPSIADSQTRAADLVALIADDNALAVLSLTGTPAAPEALTEPIEDADLLRLMIDWGILTAGAYKAMVQLYGRRPAPPPDLPSPGAASEERLWAEIVTWFEKIEADTDLHAHVQHIEGSNGDSTERCIDDVPPLIRMEQGIHRVALDMLQIAGLLPYHLYHAAHAAPPAARARSSAARSPSTRERSRPKRKR